MNYKSKNLYPLFYFFSLIALVGLTACDVEEDTGTNEAEVSEEEAAEAIQLVITPKTNGMVEATIEATVLISLSYSVEEGYAYACNTAYSDSRSISYEGANGSYEGQHNWDWLLNCVGAQPESFRVDLDGNLDYTTTRMNSQDAMQAELLVDDLEASSPNFTVNQRYIRSGRQVSKVRDERTFTSTITVVTSELIISKETQLITSGMAEVTLEGKSSTGNSFTYSGILVFNGDQTATLTMAGGNTYTFDW